MPEAIISYGTRDFIEAHRLSAHRTWRDKRRWALLVLGSILAIGILTFATDPHDRGEMLPIASVLMPLAAVAGLWLSQRASIAIHGRRALKAFPVLNAEFTYEVQPEGLLQRSKYGKIIVKWNEFRAFSEDDYSWLLYPDLLPGQSYLLPKRCLSPDFEEALGRQLQIAGVPRR
jgi:hypothetical protein